MFTKLTQGLSILPEFCLQIFTANTDTVTASMTALEPPVFAAALRLIPYSVHPRIVCLRFELHGCKDQSKYTVYRDGLKYASQVL